MILEFRKRSEDLERHVSEPFDLQIANRFSDAILIGLKAQGRITAMQAAEVAELSQITLEKLTLVRILSKDKGVRKYSMFIPELFEYVQKISKQDAALKLVDGWFLENNGILGPTLRSALVMEEPVIFFEEDSPIVAAKYYPARELRELVEVINPGELYHRPMDIKGIAAAILRPPSDGYFAIVQNRLIQ